MGCTHNTAHLDVVWDLIVFLGDLIGIFVGIELGFDVILDKMRTSWGKNYEDLPSENPSPATSTSGLNIGCN